MLIILLCFEKHNRREIQPLTGQQRNQFDRPVAAGFSFVELMIAMTLLALVKVVGLQIMQLSETSFTQGRTQLNIQQKNRAISAFIKDDFKNETLGETSTPIIYRNTAMPGDLQGDYQLNLATIFGKVGGLAALPRRQMDGHGIAGQRPGKSSGRAARLIAEYENLMMPNCASQVWHLNRLIRFIRQCLTALRFAVKKRLVKSA